MTQARTQDEALHQAYLESNDRAAFDELVRRYQDSAYRIAFARCGNHQQAEEAVQEAFLFLARNKRSSAAEFRIWFLSVVSNIARHVARSEIRALKRRQQMAFNKMQRIESVPQGGALSEEARSQLIGALAGLNEQLRTPLILSFMEGMTQDEIGQMVGVSQSRVARRISKGLETLKARLAASGITISAAVLPSALSASGLGATVSLQTKLASPSFLEQPLRYRSMRHPALGQQSSLGRAAPILLASAAIVLAGAAVYAWQTTGSSAPAKQSPATRSSDGTNLPAAFSHLWTFKNGPDDSFKLLQGEWQWRSDLNGKPGSMLTSISKAPVIKLPCEWPARPAMLRIKCSLPHGAEWSMSPHYVKANSMVPHRKWIKYHAQRYTTAAELLRMREFQLYLVDRYCICCMDGEPYIVLEYPTPYPTSEIALVVKAWVIESIEAAELPVANMPPFVKDPAAAIRELGGEAEEIGPDLEKISEKK
jgi:RNA polymerase sigma-70 factor (ECF subfamily)